MKENEGAPIRGSFLFKSQTEKQDSLDAETPFGGFKKCLQMQSDAADFRHLLCQKEFRPMGWVNDAHRELAAGRQVEVQPFGGSMRGRIESGQLVTLVPVAPSEVQVADVVFVAWRGNYLLHLVKEIKDDQFLIGNNLGKINGFVPSSAVMGKVVSVRNA